MMIGEDEASDNVSAKVQDDKGATTSGGLAPASVEDRPSVSIVTPDDYPENQKAKI